MSDDDEFPEEIWIIEGHDGRAKIFETRITAMSQYHMRLLLARLASRHLTPQQIVDAAIAKTDDLEIDEIAVPDKRVTLGTRGNPRYVAALYQSTELRRRR
jgi:hypothetical protein